MPGPARGVSSYIRPPWEQRALPPTSSRPPPARCAPAIAHPACAISGGLWQALTSRLQVPPPPTGSAPPRRQPALAQAPGGHATPAQLPSVAACPGHSGLPATSLSGRTPSPWMPETPRAAPRPIGSLPWPLLSCSCPRQTLQYPRVTNLFADELESAGRGGGQRRGARGG